MTLYISATNCLRVIVVVGLLIVAQAHGANLDVVVPDLMNRWNVPGASLAVMKDGQLVYNNAFGVANRASNRPVTSGALFQIGSISKPITATAIFRLIEQGKLSLDTKAFPLLNVGTPSDARLNEITIRHLLSHSGGWDRDISGDPPINNLTTIARSMGVASPPDSTNIVRYMLRQPLDFNPGARYAYSNLGYIVLGRAIEKVTGQSYEAFVKGMLAEVGIADMHIGRGLPTERGPVEVAYYTTTGTTYPSVYDRAPGLATEPNGLFVPESVEAAGGWIASAASLTKFLSSFDDGATRRLVSAASFAQMTAPAFTLSTSGSFSSWYGLGWMSNSAGNVWHDGATGGAQSIIVKSNTGYLWAYLGNLRIDRDINSQSQYVVDMDTTMWNAVEANAIHPVTASQTDCIFRWAERTLPQYFPPAGGESVEAYPYRYRQYSNRNAVATSASDSHVWVLGPDTNGQLLDIGPASDWFATSACNH